MWASPLPPSSLSLPVCLHPCLTYRLMYGLSFKHCSLLTYCSSTRLIKYTQTFVELYSSSPCSAVFFLCNPFLYKWTGGRRGRSISYTALRGTHKQMCHSLSRRRSRSIIGKLMRLETQDPQNLRVFFKVKAALDLTDKENSWSAWLTV